MGGLFVVKLIARLEIDFTCILALCFGPQFYCFEVGKKDIWG